MVEIRDLHDTWKYLLELWYNNNFDSTCVPCFGASLYVSIHLIPTVGLISSRKV